MRRVSHVLFNEHLNQHAAALLHFELEALAMWDWIIERLYDEPDRMISRGRAIAGAGLLLLQVGVVSWAARHIVGVAHEWAGQGDAPQTVAELFGWSPVATFWVPESASGLVIALGLTAFGYWSVVTGRQLRRACY